MSTKRIRFIVNSGAYNGGEVAGFNEKTAGEYVKRGIAEYLTSDVSTSPVTKEEPAPVTVEEQIETEKPKKKLLRRRPSRRRSTEE
jgi:hypothetical protein